MTTGPCWTAAILSACAGQRKGFETKEPVGQYLSLHSSLPFNSYTASSASLWSSNSWKKRKQKVWYNLTGSQLPTHRMYTKRPVTLTTKPNPFFKLISRIRPYPLKNFSTSLSLACGLKWPMKTRQPLIVICGHRRARDSLNIKQNTWVKWA